jgi:hypothetical protein
LELAALDAGLEGAEVYGLGGGAFDVQAFELAVSAWGRSQRTRRRNVPEAREALASVSRRA